MLNEKLRKAGDTESQPAVLAAAFMAPPTHDPAWEIRPADATMLNVTPSNVIDIRRKLDLLESAYRAAPKTHYLPAETRKAHEHAFGLTRTHSLAGSRSALIVVEGLMGILGIDIAGPEKFQQGIEQLPTSRAYATEAYRQWAMTLPDGTRARWWLLPVLYDLMKDIRPSTIRSALVGLEAMDVITKRRFSRKGSKARTKLIRLTRQGEELFKQLEAKVEN